MILKLKNEKINNSISVYTSTEHKFGTDALLLSTFSAVKHKDIVCDIGTGCGIIPLFLHANYSPKFIYGIDIQPQAIAQFQMGIESSNLSDKTAAVLSDINEIKGKIPNTYFDIVVCNPPYKSPNSGIKSSSEADLIARHETACTLNDIVAASSKLLKYNGRLCLCQRPERLCDVLNIMRANKIEPKRLVMVQQRENTAPWLFLVEGKKGAKPSMICEPTIYIEGENGFDKYIKSLYQ